MPTGRQTSYFVVALICKTALGQFNRGVIFWLEPNGFRMTYFPSRKLNYLAALFPVGTLFSEATLFSLGNHSNFSIFVQTTELVIDNCFEFLFDCWPYSI